MIGPRKIRWPDHWGGEKSIFVPDCMCLEIFERLLAVVFDSVDEVRGHGLVSIEIIGGNLIGSEGAFGDEHPGSLHIDVGEVNALGDFVIPGSRLGLGDLTPPSHLGEEPNTVGVVRVAGLVFEEDVEVRHLALVGLLEEEVSGHGVLDDVKVGTDVVLLGEDAAGFFAVDELAALGGVEPLASLYEGLGDSEEGIGIFVGPGLGDPKDLLRVILPDVIVGDDGDADSMATACWFQGSPTQ